MARIVIVHVNQLIAAARGGRIPTHPDETKRQARLHEIVAQRKADGYDTELEIHTTALGHPANIITDAATRHNADAIVLEPEATSPPSDCSPQASPNDCSTKPPARARHHPPHHPQTTHTHNQTTNTAAA